MKTGIFALALAAALTSLPAHADVTSGGLLGAVAGGLLGAQVGQGNGRIAASALGAVLGYDAGQSYSRRYYAPPQRANYGPSVYYGPAYVVREIPYYREEGYRYYRRDDGYRRHYGDD